MNVLREFESDDILYHYTKTTTALEHILFNKELRLSDRVNSNDPVENLTPSTWITAGVSDSSEIVDIDKIWNDVEKRVKQVKQVCFCKNDMSHRFKKMKDKPYEFYGCMKPRMWEQYADNYNGVCLVFSKSELEKQLNDSYKPGDIEYVRYNDLKEKESKVTLSELVKSNYETCLKKVYKNIDKFIFYKHEDYKGENEYRICSYSDKVLDVDIKLALKGIIVSKNNSQYFKEQLCAYGDKLSILEIDWKSSGVKLDTLADNLYLRRRNQYINDGLKKRDTNKKK
ncbi:DUF2971 domain-containing protein [Ancylomarina sp. 16SWW S1-10-2]|uniref:DUF2971 domain-containing protein n=1 Tax=Ancylomarina sp. 16SWW S1-10-2 TaxID=2499681 RepID=UPI0012AD21E4|nr:DUF2971 domain-containing protein [Ancylomarina sp. 16SWW S1-10-2]MRT93289.1 DUF2971 domain-containing protein [Ancylomarina sp. 16SWW S1-10-2]